MFTKYDAKLPQQLLSVRFVAASRLVVEPARGNAAQGFPLE
jgi:hypothetical protein